MVCKDAGKLISCILHPENASLSIAKRLLSSPKSTDCKGVQAKADPPIFNMFSGIVNACIEVNTKASSAISRNPLPIVTSFKLNAKTNAPFPICVTLSGISTLCKALYSKAYAPRFLIPSRSISLVLL